MNRKYIKLTLDAMADLSIQEQIEVYGFIKSLKQNKHAPKKNKKKRSISDIIGIGTSNSTDTALNHDKYLYENIC